MGGVTFHGRGDVLVKKERILVDVYPNILKLSSDSKLVVGPK